MGGLVFLLFNPLSLALAWVYVEHLRMDKGICGVLQDGYASSNGMG
jgi:hypothetical protein